MQVRHLIALGLAATATAAGAQITLFDATRLGGQPFEVNQTIPNLADTPFNDRAASAVVHQGTWQLCADAFFVGHCETLGPGDYPDLGRIGLARSVSSVRALAGFPGGGGAVIYDGAGFYGRSFEVTGPIPNFGTTGFNDRAQSMVVEGGTWELCQDASFSGRCQRFPPGRYPDLDPLSGQLSSIRPAVAGGAGWGGGTRAILYEAPAFQGRSAVLDNQVISSLDGTSLSGRASSLRVAGGYWIFCSEPNFNGECRTFPPGDYPNLGGAAISLGRRVSATYPYNQSPHWSGQR
jgi:hypothetical protein